MIGEDERLVRENESVYISATQWHRLETGSYLGDDDILRADDIYHRAADETK